MFESHEEQTGYLIGQTGALPIHISVAIGTKGFPESGDPDVY